MIETALTLRGMLDEDDYQSWPKVSRQGPTPDGAARFPDDDDAARMYYNQARRLFALATGAKDRGNVQFAERLTDVAAWF